MVDLNGDGYRDVITGSYDPGYLFIFAGQADGTFAAGQHLGFQNGKPIEVGLGSAVHAADWDGDRDLDLVVGTAGGKVFMIVNLGTPQQYRFGRATRVTTGRKPITVGAGAASPVLADWTGDGLLDLVAGGADGSVTCFRNLGTKRRPRLAPGVTLIAANQGELDGSSCGTSARVCVTDFNGDGGLDLLVGDLGFQRAKVPTAEQRAEMKKLEAELARLADRRPVATLKDFDELAKTKEYLELAYQLEAITYESHGFVWLYLRPPDISLRPK